MTDVVRVAPGVPQPEWRVEVPGSKSLTNRALLLAGVGVAVLSAVLPYSLEMSAMRAVSALTFGVMMSLEPAIAALAGLVA